MIYLVRKSVLGSGDELQDLDFDVNSLTLGSGDDCSVNLDQLFEAVISIKAINENTAKYECNENISLIVDGSESKKGKLIKGKTYQLGVYDIEIINTPAGFDFAINIIQSKRKSIHPKKRFHIDSKKSKFSVRKISYLLFFLILLIFLIVPYLGFQDKKISQTLDNFHLPDDSLWSSGPMAMAHRIPEIGDDCQVCHLKPFEKVQDKQCLDCHKNLGDHVSNIHPATDKFSEFLCENCHKEHNEPTHLTRTDNKLCIDCHKEIESYSGGSLENNKVQSVTGYTKIDHPDFRLSLIVPELINGSYEWKKSRPMFNQSNLPKEESNLKFSHTVHLDKEMVQDKISGEPLVCKNCHQLKSDEEHFVPITMDKDCRSCHQLTFDVYNPDLELPHGNLRAATVMLQAHFIREFTDPILRKNRSSKKIRRIPGKHTNEADCSGTGLDCGRVEALKEAEYQFSNSGCVTCHEVTDYENGDLLSRWDVKPIKINEDWYSKATFDHVSHLSVKGQNEQQICLSCHNVKLSDTSADIAMPQTDKCLECHAQNEQQSVELTCTRCHQFHFIKDDGE